MDLLVSFSVALYEICFSLQFSGWSVVTGFPPLLLLSIFNSKQVQHSPDLPAVVTDASAIGNCAVSSIYRRQMLPKDSNSLPPEGHGRRLVGL